MTAGLISVVAPTQRGFMPSADGPAIPIIWDTDAPGYRRIVAAEGDLSGTQPDTIKYLLEITAANGTTNNIARTVKLYTYNVESGALTYLHTVSGLPNSNTPNDDYGECFNVNVAGGYYYFELNFNLYVIGLADGVIWGASGNIGYFRGLYNNAIDWNSVPHPTNPLIFNLIYCAIGAVTTIRQVTVDSINKTVNWGQGTTLPYSSRSYSGQAMPDIMTGATPGNWLIGRISGQDGPPVYIHSNPLILNPTTGVATQAPYRNTSVSPYPTIPGVALIMGDTLLFGGYNLSNMQFCSGNPFVSSAYTNLPSWGTSGIPVTWGINPYHDFDGKFGKYLMFTDMNMDVWITRLAWTNLGVGCFGTALFRGSTVIPGMTIAGNVPEYGKPLIPCKYGAFYTGQMNTTTTAAPVIWYPLTPNLP